MWLYRGVQSAVFYYATCTPCAESLYRRKRKKEAVKTQREQKKDAGVVTDQPRPFHQPTPFTTNVYWNEEIALGPGPPTKRGGRRNADSRNGHRKHEALPELGSLHTLSRDRTMGSDDDQSTKRDKDDSKLGDQWNWARYEREDEELWGYEIVKGSSIGLSGRGRLHTGASGKYYSARNPALNDLHPPVVSGPRNRAETRWMLQPPPSAAVMAGKVRAGGRHGAAVSPTTGPVGMSSSDEVPLGRLGEEADESDDDRIDTSRTRRKSPQRKQERPPPIRVSTEPALKDLSPETPKVPRRLPLTSLASVGMASKPRHSYHNETQLSPSSSLNSLASSPPPRWTWQQWSPDSPTYRPDTKATNDSGKAFQFPLHNDDKFKNFRGLHVEIKDNYLDHDDWDESPRMRPYRWSMDL